MLIFILEHLTKEMLLHDVIADSVLMYKCPLGVIKSEKNKKQKIISSLFGLCAAPNGA